MDAATSDCARGNNPALPVNVENVTIKLGGALAALFRHGGGEGREEGEGAEETGGMGEKTRGEQAGEAAGEAAGGGKNMLYVWFSKLTNDVGPHGNPADEGLFIQLPPISVGCVVTLY